MQKHRLQKNGMNCHFQVCIERWGLVVLNMEKAYRQKKGIKEINKNAENIGVFAIPLGHYQDAQY